MKTFVAALFLGCISSAAMADAADQATLKVYKAGDMTSGSPVLQQTEVIEPAENAASAGQFFELDGARYFYSVSYAPAADYEASSVRLTVESGGASKTLDSVTLHSGKTTTVTVGSYVLAFTMEPAVD